MSRYKGIPDSKVLASVFKNLPMPLWQKIKKFKTKGKRDYKVVIHGREGKSTTSGYTSFGDVLLKDAKSVDVYVHPTDHHYSMKNLHKVWELKEELAKIEMENTRLKELVEILDRRVGERRRK
jgi:hypothetical protein